MLAFVSDVIFKVQSCQYALSAGASGRTRGGGPSLGLMRFLRGSLISAEGPAACWVCFQLVG